MESLRTAWPSDEGVARASALFADTFGSAPDGVWVSPGRLNLIGEHVDYNAGPCLPIALPHSTYVALRRRGDDGVRLVTGMGGQRWEGELDDISPGSVQGWVAYSAGPAWALREDGLAVGGFDAAIVSCVPVGAGLSSSAAIECAMALALCDMFGRPIDGSDAPRAHLAQVCVRAENEVAGAPTGGMDQAASLRTQEGHALLLDNADGSVRHVPLPLDESGLALLVIDTRASHELGDGQYGARRRSCETAADILGVRTLREAADTTAPERLDEMLGRLGDAELRARARHVITEIWRVGAFTDALESHDLPRAGELMVASHASLRDDFEVSVEELDVVVESAMAAGALGARMTGGGFGGSAVALVPIDQVDAVAVAVIEGARRRGLPEPRIHLAEAGPAGRRLA